MKEHHDVILDSINEGVFTVDREWRITSFNRAAQRITGIPREAALGHLCSEVFRASICEEACALRETLATGRPAVDTTVYIVDASGERIPIKISAAVLRDERGRAIGGVETFQDLRQVEELKKQLFQRHSVADIIGKSPAITQLFDLLPQISESQSTVLIGGRSGTGKELFARAIHRLSPRRKRRFVAVNCGAMPDTLLESELFGYKAGAFTDAKRDKAGRFALAQGGTLFLDEIGDLSPPMQASLLRVLQERTYEPLGAVEPVQTDARVVAATNKDLARMVEEGTFREDLFYRVHVIHIEIPSLRRRREDIPLLVEHFIGHLNRLQGKEVTGVAPPVMAVLMDHDYPGNVRELQNIIEHAFVLCQGGLIQRPHLPDYLGEGGGRANRAAGGDLRALERAHIAEVLQRRGGNRALAARELGIHPSTLYRKIRSLGIEVPPQDGRGRRIRA
jgi:PAS domain S-box-containing protein